MIIPTAKKIMIIPDFGMSAEAGEMLALKEAIENDVNFSITIADLRKEIQSEGLTDSQFIEACARKLEELAEDKEPERKDVRRISSGRLTITVYHTERDSDEGAPDLLVVFGKSVMLAGGVRDKKILFINPEYDSEWPWKKQYYADRDAAIRFMSQFMDELHEPADTYVYDGVEVNRRNRHITRFALRTDGNNIGEYSDRYPWLYMKDSSIGDKPDKLAEAVREFADGSMEFPNFDVYEMWQDSICRNHNSMELPLLKPLKLKYITITGLANGVPMSNGQSGLKLTTEGRSYPIPIEAVSDRQELTLLRDAVKEAVDALPAKKRILMVPDYFMPYNAPHIVELREQLRAKGHYVTVVAGSDTLEKTRVGIERRCKKKPFELIVTLETGCLLAARVTNAPRIFVNPDWNAWERIKKRLGDKKELFETRGMDNSGPFYTYHLDAGEVAEARKMGERSFIRRDGKMTVEWTSFNTTSCPTIMDSASLAKEIDKFLKSYGD